MNYEILIDKHENPKQCTIAPLRDRSDFELRYFRGGNDPIQAFGSELLLHCDGQELDKMELNDVKSFAVIDCTWKKLAPVLRRIEAPLPRLAKIPPHFLTAYPRKSKIFADPDGGLATIEAIFIAAAFLGNWDESLLDKFYFKDKFLEINADNWKRYNLH